MVDTKIFPKHWLLVFLPNSVFQVQISHVLLQNCIASNVAFTLPHQIHHDLSQVLSE